MVLRVGAFHAGLLDGLLGVAGIIIIITIIWLIFSFPTFSTIRLISHDGNNMWNITWNYGDGSMPRQDCQCLEGFEPVLRPDDDSRDAQEP